MGKDKESYGNSSRGNQSARPTPKGKQQIGPTELAFALKR